MERGESTCRSLGRVPYVDRVWEHFQASIPVLMGEGATEV